MALYGENLARACRPGMSWNQATEVCSVVERALNACYSSLSLWDNWRERGIADTVNLAVLRAISPGDAGRVREMLDVELAGIYALDSMILERMSDEGQDAKVWPDYLATLQSRVGTSSSLVALVDRLFHTSVVGEMSTAIVPVVGNLSDKVAQSLSAVLGNLIAGLWPYLAIACAALALVYVPRWRRA